MTTSIRDAQRDRGAGAALVDLLKQVGPFALAGLVGALLLLLLFAKLSEEVFSNEITAFDNNLARWVHSFANPALGAFFSALSVLGGTVGITVLTLIAFAFLMWRGHAHYAWQLAMVVVGGLIINQTLKLLFHRSRPDLWPGGQFAGFSFPSGHATLSLCLFGMFIWLGWRLFKSRAVRIGWTILMVLLILLIGLSRIYLGAHYPSDVLAGYLSGGLWLVALLSGEDIYERLKGEERPPGRAQRG
jgi:membrane-associated phospholipid phosphatase